MKHLIISITAALIYCGCISQKHQLRFASKLPTKYLAYNKSIEKDNWQSHLKRMNLARVAYNMVGNKVPEYSKDLPTSIVFADMACRKAGFSLNIDPFNSLPIKNLYNKMQKDKLLHVGKPQPGDVVFFNNTYDRNNDGKNNDSLTHIGIVETITPNNTIIFVHNLAGITIRSRMNLDYPKLIKHPKSKVKINHYLRKKHRSAYTAAQLYASFGTLKAE